MKYRFAGKEKLLALGVYPETTLSEARDKCLNARKLLDNEIDPSQAKKEKTALTLQNSLNTFKAIAHEWHETNKDKWTPRHAAYIITRMEADLFPEIGNRPIKDITPPELLACLRKIESRGALEISRRCKQMAGQVFRYAIATGRAERDPSHDITGALKTPKKKHFKAMTIKDLPAFIHALDKNDARLFPQTINATKLMMLTFVRTGELIAAKWDEIDTEKKEWHIPAERMKMKRPHIVPLCKQTLDILQNQKELTGGLGFKSDWIFPSIAKPKIHMSNGTILGAIKRLGYKDIHTGHGFRALARTVIREELGYHSEIIEKQLAHQSKEALGEAYDRTTFLKERKKMMQDWANYLDALASNGKVIRGKFRR
jgi:integrase